MTLIEYVNFFSVEKLHQLGDGFYIYYALDVQNFYAATNDGSEGFCNNDFK